MTPRRNCKSSDGDFKGKVSRVFSLYFFLSKDSIGDPNDQAKTVFYFKDRKLHVRVHGILVLGNPLFSYF